MLLHIDASAIAAILSDKAPTTNVHECLENLLVAHFQGDHIVSIEPKIIPDLLKADAGWSRRAQRALHHIDENYSQIEGLRGEASWAIEVGIGTAFDGRAIRVDDKRWVIRVDLKAFDHTRKVMHTLLMGENMTDAHLFHEFALCMRAVRRWEGLHVNCEKDQGGGDTFAAVYEAKADESRILIAIADTDKSHPTGAFGGTYGKLRKAADSRSELHHVRPLPVRTAEGLVPLDVYREVLANSPERLGSIARIEMLLRSAPDDVLKYAHLKDGIRLHQIDHATNDGMKGYWTKVAKNARRDQCNQPSANQCVEKEECKCFVVDAVGGAALSQVVAWMRGHRSKKRLAQRFKLLRNANTDLATLADEVLWWTIAFAPLT